MIFENVEFQRERERDFLPCHPFVLRDLFNIHTQKNKIQNVFADTYVYVIKLLVQYTVLSALICMEYGCMDVWMNQ